MRVVNGLLSALVAAGGLASQVHYHEDGRPWSQRAASGPDKVVEGWFYNLGVTGIRVELVADAPTHLVVRHVFAGSPAAAKKSSFSDVNDDGELLLLLVVIDC